MKKYLLPLVLLLSSCSVLISKIDNAEVKKAEVEKKFSILFSHNISGETHPCGCRNFPLGGLPQVAGLFAKVSEQSEILYVDTGDTFFPSSVIPKTVQDSLSFAAKNLAIGLEQVGLKYFVPGDQDFAMGVEFLREIANSRKFDFLISNLADENLIKHKRFAVIDRGQSKIFLAGLVDPEAFNGDAANYFLPPLKTLPKIIEEITAAGYEKNNPFHRLIVLSHAGIDPDELMAREYPFINWIIGAHSQSFLRFSKDEGDVKIVQTLSKNHYVGDIKIDLNSKRQTDTYELHEIRDELEKILNPNPMRSFIEDHKIKMNDLQIKEQSKMGIDSAIIQKELHKNVEKFRTASSCIECHKVQGDFWMGTPHSIAYTTLLNANEANNLSCIGCHSLGLSDPRGFSTPKNMVTFKNKSPKDYWNEAKKIGAHIESVRKMESTEIKKTRVQWFNLDKKFQVKENFANVQCLNCHTQENSHPFSSSAIPVDKELSQIKNKCLGCHTPDQSPEWYESGIKVNAKFDENFKKMSCPKK